MRDLLLGYLLNALEPDEKRELERRLSIDPELRRDLELLRRSLEPLNGSTSAFDPPAGLAKRTCDFIADTSDRTDPLLGSGPDLRTTPPRATPQPAAVSASASSTERPDSLEAVRKRFTASQVDEFGAPARRRGLPDLAVTAGVVVAASLLFFPVLSSMRHQSRIAACREKLHRVGIALIDYSRRHGDLFPEVADRGPLGHAGIYAPRLRAAHLLQDESDVVCPGQARTFEHIPTIDELEHADSAELDQLTRTMGGSYGYALGYLEDGKYHYVRNRNRPNFALMADAPQDHALGSLNHGCGGQNVFFEDGHASFLNCCRRRDLGDDLFANREGFVGAGIGPDDVVIGASAAAPLVKAATVAKPVGFFEPTAAALR